MALPVLDCLTTTFFSSSLRTTESVRRFSPVVVLLLSSAYLFCQVQAPSKAPQRDPLLLEVLTRVVNAAGGPKALTSVRDLTESGEITFHWTEEVKGPVVIRAIGANHFRMDADVPNGKRIFVVREGVGSEKNGDQKVRPLSSENALSMGGLTFPVGYVTAALADSATRVALLGIETRDSRSVYRVRLNGQLGLVSNSKLGGPTVKELLIDALTFDIVSVEDLPFSAYANTRKLLERPSRTVEFGDFRSMYGIRIPFSISVSVLGQQAETIHLSEAVFNKNLSDDQFRQ